MFQNKQFSSGCSEKKTKYLRWPWIFRSGTYIFLGWIKGVKLQKPFFIFLRGLQSYLNWGSISSKDFFFLVFNIFWPEKCSLNLDVCFRPKNPGSAVKINHFLENNGTPPWYPELEALNQKALKADKRGYGNRYPTNYNNMYIRVHYGGYYFRVSISVWPTIVWTNKNNWSKFICKHNGLMSGGKL